MEKHEKIIENEINFQEQNDNDQIINEDLSLLSVKELVEKINKNVGKKKVILIILSVWLLNSLGNMVKEEKFMHLR